MIPELTQVADRYGTPSYVYFMDMVQQRIRQVREAFEGRFEISFAVKSNPNPGLLTRLSTTVPFLDVSSGGELITAVDRGWDAERISFTGPGKRDPELAAAIDHGVGEVVIESVDEAQRLDRIAAEKGLRQRILIRIAPSWTPPGFGDYMAGKPCAFGIDEEVLSDAIGAILALQHVELVGLHIYSGTQCLDSEAISENYRNFIGIFREYSERFDLAPSKLVFGSGIGVPYHDNNQPVDLMGLAEMVNPMLAELKSDERFADTLLLLETGRYLVGEAGIYLTRVIKKKHSRGVEICVCDGGMHHHLAACGHMGQVIPRNYRFLKVVSSHPDGPEQAFQLVGPLCTSLDTLARNVKFNGLEVGDVLGVHCSGAYGLTSSPVHFISHDSPKEVIVETVGGETVLEDVTHIVAGARPVSREATAPTRYDS